MCVKCATQCWTSWHSDHYQWPLSRRGLLGGGSRIDQVFLAGVSASVQSSTNTNVVVIAQSGVPGTGNVELRADTGALIVSSNGWTYSVASNISGVSPSVGQVGTTVVISGSSLRGQAYVLRYASVKREPGALPEWRPAS